MDELSVMTPEEMDEAERRTEAEMAAARARPADAELERRVQEILARPYPVLVERAEDGAYVAEALDLEGCIGTGDTAAEAIAELSDAMAAWVEARLVAGRPIPEPRPTRRAYSGRFNVRLPRSLHRALAVRAESEGVSLNQYVTALLAAGVGTGVVGGGDEAFLARRQSAAFPHASPEWGPIEQERAKAG